MSLTKITGAIFDAVDNGLNVSVLDIEGVTGDGVTDDTAALQAYLDGAGSNVTLIFPAGTYVIDGPLYINNEDVTFLGYGATILGGGNQAAGSGTGKGCILPGKNRFQCHGFYVEMQARVPFIAVRTDVNNEALLGFWFSDMFIKDAFYAIQCNGEAGTRISHIFTDNIRSTGTDGSNHGHLMHWYCDWIHLNNCHSTYGQNAANYGFRYCKYITVSNCTTGFIGDTTTVDASLEIEDSPGAEAAISNCRFDHDIWVDDSSEVVISNCIARRLRFTVNQSDNDNIRCVGGYYGNIVIDDTGTPTGSPVTNAHFSDITLDPAAYSRTAGISLDSEWVGDCSFRNLKFVSNGSSSNLSLVRNATQNLKFKDVDFNGGTISISSSGGTLKAAGCTDLISQATGASAISSGSTSQVIPHTINSELGAPFAGDIIITPAENPTNTVGTIWVDSIGTTSFTVNCENDPGASDLSFGWSARRELV